MPSIKSQIITRLLQNLAPLQSTGPFREIRRVSDTFLEPKISPALHLVAGPEIPAQMEEDNQGYTLEFPLELKITLSDYRTEADAIDDLTQQVQTVIETDLQISGLVIWLRYRGDQPFIQEVTKPLGGTVLFYQIQYRRLRGNPNSTY